MSKMLFLGEDEGPCPGWQPENSEAVTGDCGDCAFSPDECDYLHPKKEVR